MGEATRILGLAAALLAAPPGLLASAAAQPGPPRASAAPGPSAPPPPAMPDADSAIVAADASRATPIDDPHGKALRPLHAALARTIAGKGTTRIAIWGASHTAADLWTGHIRRRLQARYGDAGHGFVVPVRWHGGVRHQDVVVKHEGPWQTHRHLALAPIPEVDGGFGGVAFAAESPDATATIATCTDNVCGRAANRVEVWFRAGPGAGDLVVSIDGKAHTISGRAAKARAAIRRFDVADGAHTVTVRPAGNGPVWLYGVILDRDAPGVVVDRAGIPGARAEVWTHWRADRFVKLVRHRAPQLLVLAYGTNDVGDDAPSVDEQRHSWRRVLLMLRAAAPRAACVLVGPTDRPAQPDARGERGPRAKMAPLIAMQRRVAREYGCGYWDAFAAMGGAGSMKRWVATGLAQRDHVHLSARGYEALGDRFVEALLRDAPAPPAPATPPAPLR